MAGLARGTGAVIVASGCGWTRTRPIWSAVVATALAVSGTAQPIAVALSGLGEGCAEGVQTENATKSSGSDGFEGLAA
jgi:hypothetical protein